MIGLFGGLALFLYGMEKMSTGLKRTAGNRMRAILAALTRNRIVAMFVGAFILVNAALLLALLLIWITRKVISRIQDPFQRHFPIFMKIEDHRSQKKHKQGDPGDKQELPA